MNLNLNIINALYNEYILKNDMSDFNLGPFPESTLIKHIGNQINEDAHYYYILLCKRDYSDCELINIKINLNEWGMEYEYMYSLVDDLCLDSRMDNSEYIKGIYDSMNYESLQELINNKLND